MRKNRNATFRKPEILESYYQILIEQGLEGASISKIAKRIDIHPSLIIHYFKNKENMKLELIDLLIEKYKSPELIDLSHIKDDEERFQAFIDTLFSFEWSRTVDPGIHFGFYYLSFRNDEIKQRFRKMFIWLRDYVEDQLRDFKAKGVIDIDNEKEMADIIITMMEGLEFHYHFLADEKSFEAFSRVAENNIMILLNKK